MQVIQKIDNILCIAAKQRRATRGNFLANGSFHKAIAPGELSPLLIAWLLNKLCVCVFVCSARLAQCFSLMPVQGIWARSVRELHFTWRNWCTWYESLLHMHHLAGHALRHQYGRTRPARCAWSGWDSVSAVQRLHSFLYTCIFPAISEPIVFHVSNLLAAYRFLQLARQWPALMQHWAKEEQQLPAYDNWTQRQQLERRVRLVAFMLLMLSLSWVAAAAWGSEVRWWWAVILND